MSAATYSMKCKRASSGAEGSRLRYVYANYLRPEHSNARMESWAVSETTAYYPIGKHRTPQPLPHHLLLEDGDGTSKSIGDTQWRQVSPIRVQSRPMLA